MLDAAAAQPAIGFPLDDWPHIAGSFLQLESMVEDEEARRSDKLHCYAAAIRGLAGEVPEFGDLAEALEVQNSGKTSPLLRPRRLPRENKPPEYLELALYAVAAFWCAASELHKRDEKLSIASWRRFSARHGPVPRSTPITSGTPGFRYAGGHGIRRGFC
jgi:hypothetical protein